MTFSNDFKHDYRPALDWCFFFDWKYVEKIVDSSMIFQFVIFFNGETLFVSFNHDFCEEKKHLKKNTCRSRVFCILDLSYRN